MDIHGGNKANKTRESSHREPDCYHCWLCLQNTLKSHKKLSYLGNSPMRGEALLDLALTTVDGIITEVKIGGSLGCSDHSWWNL